MDSALRSAMKTNPASATVVSIFAVLALSAACSHHEPAKGPMERAGAQVDDDAAAAKRGVKKAANKVGEETEKAGDKIKEKTED